MTSTDPSRVHRCPSCRSTLSEGTAKTELVCTACRTAYPVIDSLPVLVRDPEDYLCDSLVAISRARSEQEEMLRKFEALLGSVASVRRRDLVERAICGLRLNMQLSQYVIDTLIDRSTTAMLSAHMPSGDEDRRRGYELADAMRLLAADWGGGTDAEAQIRRIESIVFPELRRLADPSGAALFVGAGVGRFMVDASDLFASVSGVELSFPLGSFFARLRREPIDFCELDFPTMTSSEDAVRPRRAALRDAEQAHDVSYVIGDAASLPFPDGSMSVVISLFFSDVVPLSRWMPEVTRVLRPGGAFVNLGPLAYHFDDPAEWFTSDEIQEVLETVHGMQIEPGHCWHDIPYIAIPGPHRILRCWSYVAVKRDLIR